MRYAILAKMTAHTDLIRCNLLYLVLFVLEIIRDVVRGVLERAGHTVTLASNGAEALRLAQATTFDLVLMDLHIPESGGLTATGLIRALPSPNGAVPIIAQTAHGSDDSLRDCAAAGMNGFVAKPLQPQILFTEIARVSENHSCSEYHPNAKPSSRVRIYSAPTFKHFRSTTLFCGLRLLHNWLHQAKPR